MDESDLSNYNSLYTAGGAAQGTANFQNSPSYNLLFGSGAQQSYASNPSSTMAAPVDTSFNGFANSGLFQTAYGNDNSADPATRFQNDPGVQMAIQAGSQQLANNYAAKGIGASGAAAAGLSQYMYNNYNNYTQQQAALYQQNLTNNLAQQQVGLNQYNNQQQLMNTAFGNYQNQLAGVANTGINLSSALGNTENSTASSLSSLLSGNIMSTGTQQANTATTSSSSIAQLLANLGVYNSNAILSTGALQSNNMMQGSELGAQLQNNQNQQNAGQQAQNNAAYSQLGSFF